MLRLHVAHLYSHSNDSRAYNGFCRAFGTGFRQFSQRLRHAVAGMRERRQRPLALPQLRPNPGLVGEHPSGKLVGAPRTLPDLQSNHRLALSTGGTGSRRAVGAGKLAHARGRRRSGATPRRSRLSTLRRRRAHDLSLAAGRTRRSGRGKFLAARPICLARNYPRHSVNRRLGGHREQSE